MSMQKGYYCCLGAMICRGCMYYGHHSSLLWLEVWQGFISSCVEVLKGEKNGLICNKKNMSLVQSCLISVVGFNWCVH
jgi:hypothetical protein